MKKLAIIGAALLLIVCCLFPSAIGNLEMPGAKDWPTSDGTSSYVDPSGGHPPPPSGPCAAEVGVVHETNPFIGWPTEWYPCDFRSVSSKFCAGDRDNHVGTDIAFGSTGRMWGCRKETSIDDLCRVEVVNGKEENVCCLTGALVFSTAPYSVLRAYSNCKVKFTFDLLHGANMGVFEESGCWNSGMGNFVTLEAVYPHLLTEGGSVPDLNGNGSIEGSVCSPEGFWEGAPVGDLNGDGEICKVVATAMAGIPERRECATRRIYFPSGWKATYMHLWYTTVSFVVPTDESIPEGAIIGKGATLGAIDNNGNSFGAHLHYQINGPFPDKHAIDSGVAMEQGCSAN